VCAIGAVYVRRVYELSIARTGRGVRPSGRWRQARGVAVFMGGHVFISYSRHNDAYVDALASYLEAQGLSVWLDRERISTGDRWALLIRDQVDSCAAVIVVMTPEAEESEWVGMEIERARAKRKPILPLLLAGDAFFALGTLHYDDVRDARMPPSVFVQRLVALGSLRTGTPVAAPVAMSAAAHPLSPPAEPPVIGSAQPVDDVSRIAPPAAELAGARANGAPGPRPNTQRRGTPRRRAWVLAGVGVTVILVVVSVVTLSLLPGGGGSGSANPRNPVSGLIQIVNAASGRCLYENIGRPGVHLADCSEHTAAFWTLFSDGTIVSNASARCLQVKDATPHNGTGRFTVHVGSITMCLYADPATIDTNATNVWVWTCEAGATNQEWSVS
jgi:hypothetical protein